MNTLPAKVLVLDYRGDRRERIANTLRTLSGILVDAREAIDQHSYERAGYAVAFVHMGNDESESIDNERWSAPQTKRIVFSGSLSESRVDTDWAIYVSAKYLESDEHVILLVEQARER